MKSEIKKLEIEKQLSPKFFWDEQHQKIASTPSCWVISAEQLLRAFNLLSNQAEIDTKNLFTNKETSDYSSPISSTAMMLGGLAIENLLKAIHVSQGKKTLFDDNKKIHKDYKTHDCLQLAEDAGISLSEEERILLERLEHFINYGGCYPIPLYVNDMRPRKFPNGGFGSMTNRMIPNDFKAILSFVQKLKTMLSV